MEAINKGTLKLVGNTISKTRNMQAGQSNSTNNTLFHYCKHSLEIQKALLRESQRTNELLEKLLQKEPKEKIVQVHPETPVTPLKGQQTPTTEDPNHLADEMGPYIPKLNTEAEVQMRDNPSRSSAEKARQSLEKLRELKGKNDGR